MNLSRYPHPGKFEGGYNLDEYIYREWDGFPDYSFYFDDDNYVVAYAGPFRFHDLVGVPWSDARQIVASCVGIIQSNDSFGFVYTDYYTDKDAFDKNLKALAEAEAAQGDEYDTV